MTEKIAVCVKKKVNVWADVNLQLCLHHVSDDGIPFKVQHHWLQCGGRVYCHCLFLPKPPDRNWSWFLIRPLCKMSRDIQKLNPQRSWSTEVSSRCVLTLTRLRKRKKLWHWARAKKKKDWDSHRRNLQNLLQWMDVDHQNPNGQTWEKTVTKDGSKTRRNVRLCLQRQIQGPHRRPRSKKTTASEWTL